MGWLQKIVPFQKQNKPAEKNYIFRQAAITELRYTETSGQRHLYSDVFHAHKDAILIHDFVTTEEVGYFVHHLEQLSKQHPEFTDKKATGYTFGKTLFETNDLSVYKDRAKKYDLLEIELYGFHLTQRICNLLCNLSGVPVAERAKFSDNTSYSGNSVRFFLPNLGGLVFHSDLHIHKTSGESEAIMRCVSNATILSCFITYQKPESGGRLYISDLKFNDTPKAILLKKDTDYNAIIDYVVKFPMCIIDPPLGSLILFDAGQRWHMVEPPTGRKSRITSGCFNGISNDQNRIFVWS